MITVPSANVLPIKIFFVILTLQFLNQEATVGFKGSPIKGSSLIPKKPALLLYSHAVNLFDLFFFLGSSEGKVYSAYVDIKVMPGLIFVFWRGSDR